MIEQQIKMKKKKNQWQKVHFIKQIFTRKIQTNF